jgi:hypothetical protein
MALFYQSPSRNLPDGYTFRGATLNDIPVIAYLINQRQISYSGTGFSAIEAMRQEWQSRHFNPAMDVRLVFDQREQLIGSFEVWTTIDMETHPWLWGCVHTGHENRGVGTTLLRWAEARVQLAMDLLPLHLRVAPRFGADHTLATASALCQALGWKQLRAEESIVPQAKNLTSAVRLTQGMPGTTVYDIYEKEIRSGTDSLS